MVNLMIQSFSHSLSIISEFFVSNSTKLSHEVIYYNYFYIKIKTLNIDALIKDVVLIHK